MICTYRVHNRLCKRVSLNTKLQGKGTAMNRPPSNALGSPLSEDFYSIHASSVKIWHADEVCTSTLPFLCEAFFSGHLMQDNRVKRVDSRLNILSQPTVAFFSIRTPNYSSQQSIRLIFTTRQLNLINRIKKTPWPTPEFSTKTTSISQR